MTLIGDPLAALTGQKYAIDRLNAIAHDPPQSIVIEGGDADSRVALALYWAMRLNCSSGTVPCGSCAACKQIAEQAFNDLLFFDGRDGLIKVEPVRSMRSTWGQPPNGDGFRVTIFAEAQMFMTEAANALLKSLEEPRPGNVFVLAAPQRERLLETLVSRSWVVTLAWPDIRVNSPEISEWVSALIHFWGSGRGWFERTSAKGAVDKGLAMQVVLGMQRELREALSGSCSTQLSASLAQSFDLKRFRRLGLVLDQAQDALNTQVPVNPAMVLDWVATRMI
ncbi:DNA polymerase III, delta prime subunit [Pseudodesulfovibrio piezophilus]|uniref:Putative DNA polymerase III, delta prime subunit n=1 Tax=Pseudodesulfovibrio piezophilus (strain DSM 21447 / JCM 15486 / C1TLV30) TaxID=1322246 RepID=M1WU87_PSEP2|nr:DNA polymerase III, delta prime subunit [Pseudodesulfovibrio piezophilus]CCH50362.1 putative DNA polymerase III, delta prime subunit [Pseudodesulfovibrio piezophilus C1TLV30]